LAGEWTEAVEMAERGAVRAWLAEKGIEWDRLVAAMGGVGYVRARIVKGRWRDGEQWQEIPAPSLWEPSDGAGGVSLVVIPAWERGPQDDAPADLIGWDPRTGDLHHRTGAAIVLGEHLVDAAMGFIGAGLAQPLRVAGSPLSWLRRTAADEDVVMVVDWRRAWTQLGGVPKLIAETVELGEMLDKRLQPPRLRAPRILVEMA
jgi:hypothetical protein